MENVTETSQEIKATQLMRVAEVLKAISHPVRLSILEKLGEAGAMTVTELQAHTDIEQSLLSHHLIKMKDKGVLSCYREGKNRYYQLKDKHILNIFDCMNSCSLLV